MPTQTAIDKINILLVDDQPAKLLSYEVILAELGENLIKVTSAREALEQLLKNEVAVLLVDVCMPELDGFELAGLIREHPRFEKTAIIFISAIQISDLDRLRGYAAGAVDYIPVPVVPEVLRAKVKVFCELYRKTRQLESLNAELEKRVAERTAALEASTRQLQQLNAELERRIEERTRERENAIAQLFEAQKLDTIGQLTGGVAHDFNNLLMAVLGSLDLLEKRLPDDPQTRRILDNARQGAERGAALTQRLLAFARRQELKPEAVDFRQLVSGMETLIERALGPGVRIFKEFARELPLVRVDANQLELALLNLAVNARDAMPLTGVLTIAARYEKVGAETAGLRPGEYVCISVTDTGVGMDEETLAKATEPFFTTKGPGKGTGLGLSMVQGLAVQSGGTLRLSSQHGKGTTVELWLPKADGEASRMASNGAQRVSPAMQAPPRTVLIVDDDPLVSSGTAALLEDMGHVVIEASSGEQALSVLRSDCRVDLVITDQAMPGMSGTDLARRMQADFPNLPVVLATGYAELPEADIHGLTLPRLAKPYRQQALVSLMAMVAAPPHNNVIPLRSC